MADKKKGFNLAEALSSVPDLGTGRKQIEYIDIALIDSDPNNFYELSGIEDLADNINTCNGLQQPILVRTNPDNPARVIITSGHRRRAALEMLVKDGREDLREVPCIRNDEHTSPTLQRLMLILANRDTRKMTSAETSKQYEETVATLYQLQEEGYVFKGRMRDHAAEACGISTTRASNLEVIRKKLIPAWKELWEANKVNESLALTVARLPEEHQRLLFENKTIHDKNRCGYYEVQAKVDGERLAKLDKLVCPRTKDPCENKQEKWKCIRSVSPCSYETCSGKCCSTCSELARCKMACPKLADKVKKLKADAKERRQQEKLAQEAVDRPIVSKIMDLWNRYGQARAAAGKTVSECYNAVDVRYSIPDEDEVMKLECLEAKFSTETCLPYGYSCKLPEVQRFVKIADLLGCSLDYLLCRTDHPRGFAAESVSEKEAQDEILGLGHCQWHTAAQFPEENQDIIAIDKDGYATDATFKAGHLRGSGFDWDEVLFWTRTPDPDGVVHDMAQPAGQLMICGWMPGGTTPAEPCEVLAVFGSKGKQLKKIVAWNGSAFAFPNSGAQIDEEPIKWMRLPPDEECV